MASTAGKTTRDIDDGWTLEEIELRKPENGFEEAFWEQVEGKRLTRRFGETAPAPA